MGGNHSSQTFQTQPFTQNIKETFQTFFLVPTIQFIDQILMFAKADEYPTLV